MPALIKEESSAAQYSMERLLIQGAFRIKSQNEFRIISSLLLTKVSQEILLRSLFSRDFTKNFTICSAKIF